MKRGIGRAAALILAVGMAGAAIGLGEGGLGAGPPGICVAYDNGGKVSLPVSGDGYDEDKGYDRAKLIGDAVRLLNEEPSALCRMETLRRAAIYTHKNRGQAIELVARLAWRAMDAEAKGEAKVADAWFDAGYMAGTLKAYNHEGLPGDPGVMEDAGGYAWVRRAIELKKGDAEMEFGAAVLTFPLMRSRGGIQPVGKDVYDLHLSAAKEGAKQNALLAKNVKAHVERFGEHLAEHRAKQGAQSKN